MDAGAQARSDVAPEDHTDPPPPFVPPLRVGGPGLPAGVWVLLGIVAVIVIGAVMAQHGAHSVPAISATANPGWNLKASASVARASATVGGFSAEDRRMYTRGMKHLLNEHRKLGNFTIRQVAAEGRTLQAADDRTRAAAEAARRRREQAAADEKRRQREAAEYAERKRKAAIAADQPEGDPSCLKLKSWKNTAADEDEVGGVHIHGVVLNTCSDDLKYVEISFILHDTAGNRIGTAMANTSDLRAGEPWAFSAIGIHQGDERWTYRFSHLEGR